MRLSSSLFSAATVLLFFVSVPLACGQTASLDDRPCPCLEGWTCCENGEVCVAPGLSCPGTSDAGPSTTEDAKSTGDAKSPRDTGSSRDATPNDASSNDATSPDGGGARIFAHAQNAQCATADAQHLYWVDTDGTVVAGTLATGQLNVLDSTGMLPSTGGTSCGVALSQSTLFVAGNGISATALGDGGVGGKLDDVISDSLPAVVADDSFLYVAVPAKNEIDKCAIPVSFPMYRCSDPGSFITAGVNAPVSLVIDATTIYWINGDGSVMSAPKSTGVPSLIAAATDAGPPSVTSPSRLAVGTTSAGTSRLFWTSGVGMYAANADGTDLEQLAPAPTGSYSGGAVATDGTSVYWIDFDGLHKISASGGPITTLSTVESSFAFVQISGSDVYWADSSDNIWVTPR